MTEEPFLWDTGELPGAFPFTRGLHPEMYRTRLWTVRQYAGFGSAEESNRRYRYLIEQGQTGLSVAFDLPTQMGLDSDHLRAAGEVGRVGVAIDSIVDMRALFAGIRLADVSTSMTINATASILLSLYRAVAEEQGADAATLRGTVQNDILKEYMARGTYIYPPAPSMRLVTDLFAYCAAHMPRWNTISISGYHIREAGCTAAQEIAFTLADGLAYVDAAVAAGLTPEAFLPRLAFFFNVHNDFFEEIAKFRAARRIWAKIIEDTFHPEDPRCLQLRFHAQTAGSTLTAQEPHNNVVRVTLQALAAVLGGTQSLHTNSMDEALGLPSEGAAKVALRTQQILAHESGVVALPDPLGGAPAIEHLTERLEAEARALMQAVAAQGGMVAAVAAGYPQRLIEEAAYQAQLRQERVEDVVVGVNRFASDEGHAAVTPLRLDPALEAEQIQRTRDVRAGRSQAAVAGALNDLKARARGGDALLPAIDVAVRAQATVGEIADALRHVFGEHSG